MLIFYQFLLATIAIFCNEITIAHAQGEGKLNVHCLKSEKEALLKFKDSVNCSSNRLSSWSAALDCCKWKGVTCNVTTGHVISLDLHSSNSLDSLRGELSSSLLELPFLISLDLSGNDFLQTQVPGFLGSLHNLEHLNISGSNFKGTIPDHIGNLSRLQSLDLSDKRCSLRADNLEWIHNLSSLRILNLNGVDLGNNAEDWSHAVNTLPHLVELHLSVCRLRNLPPSLPEVNFVSLELLDLSHNYFNATLPGWLFKVCHNLRILDLSNNQLQGQIPDSFEKLSSLVVLDLSNNGLIGPIPSTLGRTQLGRHSSLKELRLSNNRLNGTMNRIFEQLSELVVFDVAQNELQVVIKDVHLENFSSLKILDLSANNVTFNVSENWAPAFQLDFLGLGHCKLGPQFPKWIQTQKNFSYIDISFANISDTVPSWFWSLSPRLKHMNLSYNDLKGHVHDFSSELKLETLDLINNSFTCPLPRFPTNMKTVNLAGNIFSGPISRVCEMLSVNNSLHLLDLSLNILSGILPNCWSYGENLVILNLADNHFSGSIPDSFGGLLNLHTLSLSKNNLVGEIPVSMKYCTQLIFFDISHNQLSGTIPSWIGEELQILKVLMLSHNAFEGNIPALLCQLKSLQILDLSVNKLTGAIPRCVFAGMAGTDIEYPYPIHRDGLISTWRSLSHSMIIQFMVTTDLSSFLRIIDLSSNSLTEDIPEEIASLVGLLSLNLSRNQLVGSIPSGIGGMKSLELLDLSRNQLSCAIPPSMSELTFLSLLNLSYNRLSGEIPKGNQLETFDSSSFIGNQNLCGSPLTKKCPPRNESDEDPSCRHREEKKRIEEDKRQGLEIPPFYISMGVGFMTGFWVLWGSLILSRRWRHAYFSFLSRTNDRLYVMVALSAAKLKRKFQSQQSPT